MMKTVLSMLLTPVLFFSAQVMADSETDNPDANPLASAKKVFTKKINPGSGEPQFFESRRKITPVELDSLMKAESDETFLEVFKEVEAEDVTASETMINQEADRAKAEESHYFGRRCYSYSYGYYPSYGYGWCSSYYPSYPVYSSYSSCYAEYSCYNWSYYSYYPRRWGCDYLIYIQ